MHIETTLRLLWKRTLFIAKVIFPGSDRDNALYIWNASYHPRVMRWDSDARQHLHLILVDLLSRSHPNLEQPSKWASSAQNAKQANLLTAARTLSKFHHLRPLRIQTAMWIILLPYLLQH